MLDERPRLSRHAAVAEAMDYMLSGIDAQAWLAGVLERIADLPVGVETAAAPALELDLARCPGPPTKRRLNDSLPSPAVNTQNRGAHQRLTDQGLYGQRRVA